MSFVEGGTYILNSHAKNGLPCRVGELCKITDIYYSSPNYSFLVEFYDHDTNPVREKELSELTDEDKKYMEYIFRDNKVKYEPSQEIVHIVKVDYLYQKVEVKFYDESTMVVDFSHIKQIES